MVSSDARKATPRSGARRQRLAFCLTVTLTALLSSVAAPRVHAQNPTPGWENGTVEVNTSFLEIERGKSTSYSLRLSKPPTADGWWVRVHVDDAVRVDGNYKGLSWVPSVGWEFDGGENPWRTINISVDEDAVVGTEVTFDHDVWDHTTNCPVHDVGRLTVRIVADRPPEPLPELSIRDAARVTEGDAASFEIRLSKPSDQSVTVRYETEGGTADEGTDFDRASGMVRFDPNDTSQTIQVQTREDELDEPDENFTVKLSSPNGATLDDDTGTGTIRDDDDAPKLSIGDATVGEGGTARFQVTLSKSSGQDVTVRVRTGNGTAQAGSDYDAVDTTLTFSGTTQRTVDVPTTEDDDYEADETFTVRLSSPNGATIEDGAGDGTITNDDSPPRLSIEDVTVEEGDRARFAVTLSAPSHLPVTVRYSTLDGTAVEDSDYTAIDGGTLTFSAGRDRETIEVRTREDTAKEPDTETFTVVLSDPEGATIDRGTGTGTITDDDEAALPSLRIEDTTVTEGGAASFKVKLSVPSDEPVTVGYETRDGTARAGSDYTAAESTAMLTFPANSMERTIEVETLPDEDYEGSEAFTVRLRNPGGATLDDDSAEGTIEDDDDPPQVFIENDVTVDEGNTAPFV